MVWRRDGTRTGEVKTSGSLRKQVLGFNCPLYLYEREEAEAAHRRTRASAIGNAVVATSTRPEPHPPTYVTPRGAPAQFLNNSMGLGRANKHVRC